MASVEAVVVALFKLHGRPAVPASADAWQMILLENVAYLVDDQRRQKTWAALTKCVGSRGKTPTAKQILNTHELQLAEAIEHGGMQPLRRAGKLKECASLLIQECDGNPKKLLAGGPAKARARLKKFPGIGGPGADKILLFTREEAVLALDSNGLRTLTRFGFGVASDNYAPMYKSVQEAVKSQINKDVDWLIAAHQVLRMHGQEVCTRSSPNCASCPLAKHGCSFAKSK